jgi:hypothetical protein
MIFNISGQQKAVITVEVPGNFTMGGLYNQVNLIGQASFFNETVSGSITGWINITQRHDLEVTYSYVKKEQFMNQIEFIVTNKGNGVDNVDLRCTNNWDYDNLRVTFNPYELNIEPANSSLKVDLIVKYSGSRFPKVYNLNIRFQSHGNWADPDPYHREFNVTVSFIAPDRALQNYLFVSTIVAFIIIMEVVMVLVIRRSGKAKK